MADKKVFKVNKKKPEDKLIKDPFEGAVECILTHRSGRFSK